MSPEERFVRELEFFDRDSTAAIQYLFAYLAFHQYASTDKKARAAIDQRALFWNTNLGALQVALFIALGRAFDERTDTHNIKRLVELAKTHPEIFSRAALAARKRKLSPGAKWIRGYVREAHEPTPGDFRRIQRFVDRRRSIYRGAYGAIRHKIFAHNDASSFAKASAMFSRTQVGELQRLVLSLRKLHEVFWQLLYNGHMPTLRGGRYSLRALELDPSRVSYDAPLEQRVYAETRAALARYAAGPD